MKIEWTEDLRTGVDEIDNQHKDLLFRMNEIMDACERQKGKEEIGAFVSFLVDYAILHFATEEKEMIKYNYPGLIDHKIEHSQFSARIGEVDRSFIEQGARIDVLLSAVRASCDWLQNHIRTTDKALGQFLQGIPQA